MQAVFKYELDNTELEKIKQFCNSVDYCSIEQAIGWTKLFYKSKICYFYLQDEIGIKSFCQISEHLRSAHINFGPVCCEKEAMVVSIKEIIKYYKQRRYLYLGVQMYYKSGYDSEYIEYAINREHKIKYIFDPGNTKSTIEIDLESNIDEIFNKFRKGHKSDIKRAVKLGVTINTAKNTDELDSFIEVYSKMCQVRNISDGELSKQNINEIYNYLTENNKGQILIVKDNDGIVIGGAILAYQGVSVRYLKGTSDPGRRDIPILHLVIYEAIKNAKSNNFRYFDMWGYNHFVSDTDQVYYINHFKKGFGGYFTFFAKKMNISLIPGGYNIYSVLSLIRRIYLKFH